LSAGNSLSSNEISTRVFWGMHGGFAYILGLSVDVVVEKVCCFSALVYAMDATVRMGLSSLHGVRCASIVTSILLAIFWE